MQREISLLAGTLGERFRGQPVDALDALGVMILRRQATRLRAAYTPGRPAILVVAPTQPLEKLAALALAHHLLRHRSQLVYPYDHDGPLYNSPREWWEAQMFTRAFLAQRRPAVDPLRGNRRRYA